MQPVPLSRLCTVRVIFPVPAPGTGHQPRVSPGGKLWPGPVLQVYRGPIARPIRSGRHWLGSDQRTNEQPAFVNTDWKLWLCPARPAKASRCPGNLEMHHIMIPIADKMMSIIIESQMEIEFFAPYFMLSWWMLKCCVKSTIKCSALADNVPIDWSTKTGLTTPGAAQPFIEFQQNSWRKFHLPVKTCCLFLNWFRTDIWEVESEQEVSGGTFAYKASNYRQFEEPLNLAILKILCFIP